MDLEGFYRLIHMLAPRIEVNQKMAKNGMGRSKSGPISPHMRVGITLVLLGAGRIVEAIRTFGVAAYKIFWTVIDATLSLIPTSKCIVTCPERGSSESESSCI
jgi:hypothetical protein